MPMRFVFPVLLAAYGYKKRIRRPTYPSPIVNHHQGVGLPRFELGQTEPKSVVLPLHHSPNTRFLLKSGAKVADSLESCKFLGVFFRHPLHYLCFYAAKHPDL